MVPPGKCGSRISCRYLLYLVSFWEKITKNHIYYHFLIRISFLTFISLASRPGNLGSVLLVNDSLGWRTGPRLRNK